MKKVLNEIWNLIHDIFIIGCVIAFAIYYALEKPVKNLAFYCLLPFAWISYLFVDNYRNIKRRKHRNHLHKIGRSTMPNPYVDNWN